MTQGQSPPADGGRATARVTAFVGSAHRGGATFSAARTLLDLLEAFGDVEGEVVVLNDFRLGLCRGCKVCFDRGEEACPVKDDRDELLAKMEASDAMVFATPNYSFNVSGVMKVFLDRLGFACHRPRFHGKTATAIVVQGIFRGHEIRKYLEFVSGVLGFTVVRGTVIRTLEPMTERATEKMNDALADQARRFHAQLLKPAFPTPSLVELMAFRMNRTSFRLLRGEETRDFTYFRDHGWFTSEYYYPTRLGPFKKLAGHFFDWVGERVSQRAVAPGPHQTAT